MSRRVIMFQDRFAQKVERGDKPHTIRPELKYPIFVGDILDLRQWSGKPYRSKQRKLRTAICCQKSGVVVHRDGVELSPGTMRVIFLGETGARRDLLEHFARRDGFTDWAEMRQWFDDTHGLPFEGVLIEWTP